MRSRLGNRRRVLLAAVAVLSAAAVAGFDTIGVLHAAELKSVDARFRLRGSRNPPQDVVLVAIDNKTLSELNRQPPLPRSLYARMIDLLHRARARVIAYDLQFIGRSSRREDSALVAAVARARPVALATHDVNGPPLRIPAGIRNAGRIGAVLGSVGVPNDSDGEVRHMLYAPVDIKSFPIVTASLALGHPVSERQFPNNSAWIDYLGGPGTVPTFSFSDVLAGQPPPGAFAGKTVIVGYTDPALKDTFLTPLSDNVMSGPELNANAVETILDGFPLRSAPAWLDSLVLVAAAALVPLVGMLGRATWMIGAAGLALVLLFAALQLAFDAGLILNAAAPTIALLIATIGSVASGYLIENRERRHLRLIFSRFVPPDVVDAVIERADADLRLGGIRRDCTVLFADLRGFTTFAEELEPERLVAVVNQYFSEMTAAVHAHGGTLVSYLGDGLMALFGAPLEQPDHADRAVGAAREMLSVGLSQFNAWLAANGFDKKFRMGIGVNSGLVASGNVGSMDRLEYTALGDTTNTASRLEHATKDIDHQVLISASTRERLTKDAVDLLLLGELTLEGRSEPTEVWTLREDGEDPRNTRAPDVPLHKQTTADNPTRGRSAEADHQ